MSAPRSAPGAVRASLLLPALLVPALLLAACDGPGGSSGPGAVSEGEARALDEAAEMLEERNLPDGVLPATGPGANPREEAPEPTPDETTDP